MLDLLDLERSELEKYLKEKGVPSYRTGQISSWLYKGASFDEMTDIPEDLRRILKEECKSPCLGIVRKLESKLDETVKYLFDVGSGDVIESVLMKYKYGWSACISSQIGCRMGCRFCASSKAGFRGNLTPGQMLGQIITMNKDMGIRIGHVVIMGIGEPMDNYENVISFLSKATSREGLGISVRHISVSTCGVVPGIQRLAKEKLGITLSVSLHAPNDEIRSSMMPVNNKYSIDKLLDACNSYVGETGRRITFEYSMIKNVNDSPDCARQLAQRLKGMLCHVNLIPVNSIRDGIYERSGKKDIETFRSILESAGISATVRRELGRDINAACGQLRRSTEERASGENADVQ